MSERVAPHNLQAEQGVIGAMLYDRRSREAAIMELDSTDFYRVDHMHAFEAICQLVDAETVPDVRLTVDQLRRNGHEHPAITDLTGWLAEAPSFGSAVAYIGIIRDDSRRRLQLHWANEALEALYGGRDPGPLLEAIASSTPAAPAVSWTPVDLVEVLAGGVPEVQPVWLVRDDGQPLLYPGKVHAFNGESESGKTWLAWIAVAHAVRLGEWALYVDFEDDQNTAVARLAALGMDADDISRVIYIRPEEALSESSRARLAAAIEGRNVALAVVDGVAEALTQNGWDENTAGDVVKFFEALPRWLARVGAAVVLIDHVTKDREEQGRYARGSGAKLAGIDVAYKIETVAPFGRGKSGRSRALVMKDRHGWVRRYAGTNRCVAELVVVSSSDGTQVTLQLIAPSAVENGFRPTILMERVSRTLEQMTEPISANKVRQLTTGKQADKTKALQCLAAEGFVKVESGRSGELYRSIRPFREQAPEPPADYQTDEEEDY